MRKIAPVAFLTAGFLVFGGLLATPASADDEDIIASTTSSLPRQGDDDSSEFESDDDDSEDASDEDDDADEDESDAEEAEEAAKHKELRDKYGDDGKMMLPPLVIKPKTQWESTTNLDLLSQNVHQIKQASLGGFIAVNPRQSSSKHTDVISGKNFNPEQNAPIQISTVNYQQKPTVDTFIEAAKVGLGVMLIGVLALGLVAGYRAIRHK